MNEKYFLESTNDRTDVTAVIEKMLKDQGVCRLGSGVFYVSGVNMPDGTAIIGNGNASKIVLAPEIEAGYAVKLGSFCTVKDVAVLGSEELIALPEKVGERHGLAFLGKAVLENWQEDQHRQPMHSIISSCYISSFTGGGITCDDTGYSPKCAIVSSDCHIRNCGAGINIPYWSEFHKFTNILSYGNLYGCVNNGGNNVFVNCGFTSNKVGFLIDNSHGNSENDSHGSAIGCTFHHSDNNKGVGIMILGARCGYIFSGGQIGFSEIVIENSRGIVFDGMNIIRNTKISVTGGKMVAFTSCAFYEPINITRNDNDMVRVSGCYYFKTGEEVTI